MEINKVYQPAFHSQHRYLVLRGGAGSGKSVFATQKILARILTETGHKFLILRKVGATIKNSVFSLFKELIYAEGLQSMFIINKSDYSITCTLNKNTIVMQGVDEIDKLKSIAGITGVMLEEAAEFTEDEWLQIQLRVRGLHPNYVQFILCFNPVSEESWLKKIFWDAHDDDENIFKLVTTYKDNGFLSKDDIRHFEERLIKNPMYWKVYGLGQWGSIQTGGEMVKSFNYVKHISNTIIYNPLLPLHISFDFNNLPGVSVSINQVIGKNIKVIDEIQLPHPNNNTKFACHEFIRKYPDHQAGLFIYGDPSGRAQSTKVEQGVNDFSIITKELNKYKPTLRIIQKAPSVAMSTNFLNDILSQNAQDISISLAPNCKKIIDDMLYLKEAADGGKLITYTKTDAGVRFEQYGHMFDNFRYFLCQAFAAEYATYQTGNKPFATVTTMPRIQSRNSY